MKKFSKTNLNDIPLEDAHKGSGKRQVLLNPEQVRSQHWEAVTKGFLDKDSMFDWHNHEGVDEVFIVLKGSGNFYCEDNITPYAIDDVVTVSANTKHKIEAVEDSEFFFIRIKV